MIGRPSPGGRLRRALALAAALAPAILSAGCGGARSLVHVDHCRYPLSMSSWVPDRDGDPVRLDAPGFRVGRLLVEGRGWSMVWTNCPLGTLDLSDEVNRQVSEAGGDAVIHLRVTASWPTVPDLLPNGIALHWLPLCPGSVLVRMTGDIVRAEPVRSGEGEGPEAAR